MNEEELIKQLEQIDLSDITLPGHQRRLGQALLDSGRFKPNTPMSMIRKASPIGGVIIAAAVIAVFVLCFKTAPRSSAQQVAQRSYKAVTGLPPARQAALKIQLGLSGPDGLDNLLRQAENAKDLRVLTPDELNSQFPGVTVSSTVPGGGATGTTFLTFSGQDGIKYAVGVDNDSGLPTLAVAYGGPGKAVMAVQRSAVASGPAPQVPEEMNVRITTDKHGAVMHINGKKIPLPPGIDPQNAKVLMQDGKIFVNGQEVKP